MFNPWKPPLLMKVMVALIGISSIIRLIGFELQPTQVDRQIEQSKQYLSKGK